MKLFESPDSVLGMSWIRKDALTFAYVGREFFADFQRTHYNLTGSSRDFLRLPGRLWVNSKIISFWKYPNITELYELIDDINKHLISDMLDKDTIHNLIDNTWQIDLYEKIISIDDYVYYLQYNELPKRSEEELSIDHTDDPQEKERKRQLLKQQGKELPKGYFKSKYDIPAKFDYMRRKYMFQEKFNDFQKLNESPDKVEYKDDLLGYRHIDAVTFGYYDGEMLTGYNTMTHGEFGVIYGEDLYRSDLLYPGRLWKNSKIISFWKYPKPEELNKVLKDIENSYHNIIYTPHTNNRDSAQLKDNNIYIGGNLLVSVYFNDDKKDFKKVKNTILRNYKNNTNIHPISKIRDLFKNSDGIKYYTVVFGVKNTTRTLNIDDSWKIELSDGKIIPITDYIGSAKRSEEELRIDHTDNPQEKERKRQLLKQQGKELPKGYFKSDVPAKYDYYRRKYMFQEKFNDFQKLNECPDRIEYGDVELTYYNGYPFETKNIGGKWISKFGDFGKMHLSCDIESIGRLWLDEKVISFWEYPKLEDMEEVLRSIEKAMYEKHEISIDFNDEDWIIEVLETDIELSDIHWKNRSKYIEKLIPLKDYVGSLNPPEHIKILHQLDAKNKREELKKMGYKSKTRETSKLPPVAYRDKISKYKYTENVLNENPNNIRINGRMIFWDDFKLKPYVFSYYFDEFYIRPSSKNNIDTHDTLWYEISGNLPFTRKYDEYQTNRGRGELSGRLWLEEKIISFWDYPENKEELKKVANDIKKHSGIDIWKDDWKIEIVEDVLNWQFGTKSVLIPIKQYVNSKQRPEEELRISHTDDPQEKERKRQLLKQQGKDVKGYFKSKYDVPAKYDYYRRKYMFQEKLNETGDAIMVNGVKYNLDCEYSYPFVILNNKVYFGDSTNMHSEISKKYNYGIDFKIFCGDYGDEYETMGRIWIDKKIISFWTMKFKDIIKTLKDIQKSFYNEHKIRINFFDDEWKIDVNNENEIEKLQDYLDKIDYYKYDYYLSDEYNYIIPINDYLKYIWDKDMKKELDVEKYKLHLLSAQQKREKLKKMGYKSKTRETSKLSPVEYRDKATKYHFTESFKLFENPDWVDDGQMVRNWADEKTITFLYHENKFYYHTTYTHAQLLSDITGDILYTSQEARQKLSGRLFLESKIITFWIFPDDKEELKKVVSDIEKNIGIDIWNDKWRIDVWDKYDAKLIPIKDYVGSDDRSEEELSIDHTDDPQEKERKRQLLKKQGKEGPKGYFKSKYDVPAKYDYYRRKYMFQEKFNENADTFYINQKRINYFNPNSYPFSHDSKKIQFGDPGSTHGDCDIYFEDSHIDGRLWLDYKVILFWKLISDNLTETFNEISEEFYLRHDIEIDFFDGDWLIGLESKDAIKLKLRIIHTYKLDYEEDDYRCLVKLEDYINSENTSRIEQDDEIRNLHLNKNKREILLKQGYKSKTKETSKLPPAAYRDKISKYHFTEKFNNFKLI